MITFYPGPSKVYPQIETYLRDAYQSGILSVNHRSEPFMQMLAGTIKILKSKLAIPEDYEVYFVSSATECWEIIAQSFMISGFHVYNGAFGEKWMEYTRKLRTGVSGRYFDCNELPATDFAKELSANEIICITHNETSNGTVIPDAFFKELRLKTGNLIAVDATSSMAGVALPWTDGDIWYASVQKCFGLPPGMGVMVVSPAAISQAKEMGEAAHYNSFLFIRDNFLKQQTPYTPNSLGIYLLGRVLEQVPSIAEVSEEIKQRAKDLYSFFENVGFAPLIENDAVRSDTVLAIKAEGQRLSTIKSAAKSAGIVLGNGYGSWKENTFRVANFPAITSADVTALTTFFHSATVV
ncbi:Phosphoserine aminotransferase [Dyadobacter sp. CECT 9275]|uniref:phosphoserine transaminase n=1 Tax=Dyadobacter helix TaxID=2822344 RepID=A0A916JE11_9BACT|nr:aminotransferase class V-fold PLP-dependent enzyme [Dyadobacter sp. CECT 9275]CAG5002789.1 Phosphoserine aminotransferase [Dyadobacter sp. CECT 9275]